MPRQRRIGGASHKDEGRMSVVTSSQPGTSEDRMIQEMARDGFEAATQDYDAGATEPHQHDYDVCLYILEGEFRLREVERSIVHRFRPGDKICVYRGTVHAEDHGPLRMIVGRRH
jgi:quercetin dioxygenase-like cupin family protein